MGEIYIPLVGWHIGAFGHVAKIAQIALVSDLHKVGLVNAVYFHSVGFVYQVKQGGKRVTQAYAAPTTVAYIIYPLQLNV
jgi:hypothetical protein